MTSVLESLATDGEQFYRFTSTDSDRGALYVYAAPTLDSPKMAIDSNFLGIINSLWSHRGQPLTNVFQRPDTTTEVGDYEGIRSAVIIRTKPDDATEVIHILDPSFNFARRFEIATVKQGGQTIQVYQNIVPTRTSDGRIVPSRVVEIVDLGGGSGYTTVTDLEFLPTTTSSLPRGITVDSFSDLGLEYQVYHAGNADGRESLGPRVQAARPGRGGLINETSQSADARRRVFVIAIVLTLLLVSVLAYLRWRPKIRR